MIRTNAIENIFLFLLFPIYLSAAVIDLTPNTWTTPITLEHTDTWEKQQWGMMGRDSIEDHWGMTFSYEHPKILDFWMFNTGVDLDIAFLDENKIIQEIHHLKAYPEKMDPNRPIRALGDFIRYPRHDPIVQFFLQKAIHSQRPLSFAVETRLNWFQDHNIEVGDVFLWDDQSATGTVLHTLTINSYPIGTELIIPQRVPIVVVNSQGNDKKFSAFDAENHLIKPFITLSSLAKSEICFFNSGVDHIQIETAQDQ